MKANKTKNTTNKPAKERTSIAGAIVKLLEQQGQQGEGSGIAANMNMTMMRQMDRMNRSMDKQERREEKERKKRRKRKKKKKARKKAACTDAVVELSSSSSSSSSDSDGSSDDSDDINSRRKSGKKVMTKSGKNVATDDVATDDDGGGKFSATELQEMQEYERAEALSKAAYLQAAADEDYEREQFDRRGR